MLNTVVSSVRKYWIRAILVLLMLAVVSVTAAFLSVKQYLETPIALNNPQVVMIEPGSSLIQITRMLENQGILTWPRVLVLWARWQGIDRSIRTGEYELTPGLTPVSLMSLLMSGRNVQYPVTLVEGWTVRQALEHLWAQESVRVTLDDKTDEEIMEILQSPFPALEGNLFPDTYFFTRNTTDEAIIKRAHTRLLDVLESEWQTRQQELPYDSPWQALIMASIIEKESGYQAEKADIAGVFVRRLKQGMRLQSDPTIIYGMGSAYTGVIRRSDIDTTTPWNTYRVDGLPPTPIAISGRDSIRASLNPNPGTALYFVSRGDGSHQFSDTLQEHNAAVRRYLRNNNE
ncbi:endolytic transglycosylase MltG [Gammaproteobacteria bacterium LSUCC0112]|nr:endolytic transglycosylase MltG [Gammaproteobacteria bacterium LSUCC0112]